MKHLNKTIISDVTESVRKLYEAKQELEKATAYYQAVKNKESVTINNFFFQNCEENENNFFVDLKEGIRYYTDNVKLKVTKIRTKKIVWNLEKLKKKLSREKFQSITEKKYVINDMDNLIVYLKECGVNPAIFKSCIDVEYTLDEHALEKAYSTGKIKMSEVNGCYTVDMGESYIRLQEVKQ